MFSVVVRVPGEIQPSGGSVRESHGNMGEGPRCQSSEGCGCHEQQSGVTHIDGENGNLKEFLPREVTLHVSHTMGNASLCTLVVSSIEAYRTAVEGRETRDKGIAFNKYTRKSV